MEEGGGYIGKQRGRATK